MELGSIQKSWSRLNINWWRTQLGARSKVLNGWAFPKSNQHEPSNLVSLWVNGFDLLKWTLNGSGLLSSLPSPSPEHVLLPPADHGEIRQVSSLLQKWWLFGAYVQHPPSSVLQTSPPWKNGTPLEFRTVLIVTRAARKPQRCPTHLFIFNFADLFLMMAAPPYWDFKI